MSEEAKEEKPKKSTVSFKMSDLLGDAGVGLGCFFICLGIAVLVWAFSGFPGLPR